MASSRPARTSDLAVGETLLEAFASGVDCTVDVPTLGSREATGNGLFRVDEEAHNSTTDAGAAREVPEKATVQLGGRWSSRTTRLRCNEQNFSGSSSSSSSLLERDEAETPPPAAAQAVPQEQRTPAALKQRLVKLFLTAEKGPVATQSDVPAAGATLGYVIDVDAAVRLFWKANAAEIKRRCVLTPQGLLQV